MSHNIVLIHGTFAPKAAWTLEGSPLMKTLEMLGHEMKVETLDWTGGNSFSARRQGVLKLQGRLRELLESDPDTRISIVAHSHGGNIAMATVEDDQIRAHVSGIVCLSTPFIIVGEHAFGLPERGRIYISILLKLIPWLAYLFLLGTMVAVVASGGDGSTGGASIIFLLGGVVYGTTRYVRKRHSAFWGRYSQEVADFIAENSIRNPDDLRLLVLRPVADEASGAMNAMQIVSWLSTQLWNIVSRIPQACFRGLSASSDWSKRRSGLLWALVLSPFIVAAALLTTPWAGSVHDRQELGIVLCVASAVLIPLLRIIVGRASLYLLVPLALGASILLLLLFMPIVLAVTLAAAPFGLARIYLFPNLRISAEAAPVGHSHIVQLSPTKSRGWMHSTTYQDSVAIDATVQWLMHKMS